MKFSRIKTIVFPDGSIHYFYPFHVCTEGQEDKVIFRDEEDLRVAHNFIPICAKRHSVIVVIDCVLHTHMHADILAESYEDAKAFADDYKKTTAVYIQHRHGVSKVYSRIESKPIYIDEDRYLRNTICYIPRNSLDMNIKVDEYKWSGFRSLFCKGEIKEPTISVSEMKYRDVRRVLKTSDNLKNVPWRITVEGVIEPASYCDWKYAESAFFEDVSFFYRVLGLTDDEQMRQILVLDPNRKIGVGEILNIAEERSLKRFSKPLLQLTMAERVPIIKALYYTYKVSPSNLARCFETTKENIVEIVKRKTK